MRTVLRHAGPLNGGGPPLAGGGRRRRLDTTAERLRLLQIMLMVTSVVCGAVAAGAVQVRMTETREIEQRTEPLSADAVDVYRALADADAAVAQRFLRPDNAPPELVTRYEGGITNAATSLTRAGTLTRRNSLTADRITDISVQLPMYAALVERALVDSAGRLAALKSASALMQSTILRRAEAFQRTESQRLDTQYRRAGALPRLALAAGATSLLALLGAQVMLTRKTKRLFNLGLLAASAVVLGVALWWTFALSASDDHLADSRRHSQSVSDALGQAQIAARQARASEILALVTDEPDTYEEEYSARMQRLSRADGAGGALGAARRLIPDQEGQSRVTETVADARSWLLIHGQIHELHRANRDQEAVNLALGSAETESAAIDGRLAQAVDSERHAFGADIQQAEHALDGLVPGTVALMLVAAGAGAVGIGQRLKEYR